MSARTWSVIVSCAVLPVSIQAQTTPAPCSSQEHRQFDFWIGEWTVQTASGATAGENRIEPILGGCALQESWTGTSGSVGHSYNAYDRARGVWHQTWVDNSGLLLQIDGGLQGGAMVMTGTGLDAQGRTLRHRITWSVMEQGPDHVRQLWEQSTDDGTTWTVVFDGHYIRKGT